MAKKKIKQKGKGTSQLASKPNKSSKRKKSASQLYEEQRLRNLKQRAPSIPKSIPHEDFDHWKEIAVPLVEEANRRIELIQASRYSSIAYDRVIREGGKDYFDISDITDKDELVRDVTRMRVFINDKGSTLEGAKIETAQASAQQYKGMFGNQYKNKENGYATYNKEFIDKDAFERACTNYHKIAEVRSSQIANEGGYGSENFIMALYDAEIKGHDSLLYGIDLLTTIYETETDAWKRKSEEANSVTGLASIIIDNITGGYSF